MIQDMHRGDPTSLPTNFDIAKLKARDESEWIRLFHTYSPLIAGMVHSYRSRRLSQESEDIRQETFVRTYQSINAFNREAGMLWPRVKKIALNVIIDTFRTWNREILVEDLFTGVEPDRIDEAMGVLISRNRDAPPSPTKEAELMEVRRILAASLAALNMDDLLIIRLRYFNDEDWDSIGQALGIGSIAARVRGFRALRKVKREMQRRIDRSGRW